MRSADLDYTALIPLLAPLEGAPRWRVAWSGGLDSTVLLHLLTIYRTRRPLAPPLLAVHVNHQLQPAAADWAEHCRKVAGALSLPLRSSAIEVSASGAGLEADARHARYAALEEGLAPGEVVMFAHHRDDQAETVLLRLLRGSGVTGLQGMPRQRPMGRGQLLRPLLPWSRSQLEAYARCHGLNWIEDPSNSDLRHDRNFLRAQVMPLLASRWPDSQGALLRAAAHLEEVDRALEALLPPLPRVCNRWGDCGLDLEALLASPDSVVLLQLRRWLREQGLQAPDSRALRELLRQLRAGGARARLATGNWALERFGAGLFLLPAPLPQPLHAEPVPLQPGRTLALPFGRMGLEPAGGQPGFRLAPGETPQLRWRGGGERLRLPGREGSRALKKLLQEEGVPPWWRQRLPLVFLGEELLAVADLWLCASSRYAATGGRHCWRPVWEPRLAPLRGALSPRPD